MNQILTTILENTYTLHELKHKVRVLRSYVEAQIFSSKQIDLPAEDAAWIKTLPPELFKSFDKNKFTNAFAELDKEVAKINPLTIYLAFTPGKEEIELIQNWIRQNISTKVVIETKLNPSLIGGCALVWNGIYKDYSIKSRIEARKEAIMQSLKTTN